LHCHKTGLQIRDLDFGSTPWKQTCNPIGKNPIHGDEQIGLKEKSSQLLEVLNQPSQPERCLQDRRLN
jgi:hypothetical protein